MADDAHQHGVEEQTLEEPVGGQEVLVYLGHYEEHDASAQKYGAVYCVVLHLR